MAKIVPYPMGEIEYMPQVATIHSGGAAWEPDAHHWVVWFTDPFWQVITTAEVFFETSDQAAAACHTYASMPQMMRDLCPWCRGFRAGPTVTRWNIYRGETRLIIPPTEYWGEIPPLPPWF